MIHCEKYITAPFKWIDMCPSFLTRAKPFEGGYSFIGLTAFAGLTTFAGLTAFVGCSLVFYVAPLTVLPLQSLLFNFNGNILPAFTVVFLESLYNGNISLTITVGFPKSLCNGNISLAITVVFLKLQYNGNYVSFASCSLPLLSKLAFSTVMPRFFLPLSSELPFSTVITCLFLQKRKQFLL